MKRSSEAAGASKAAKAKGALKFIKEDAKLLKDAAKSAKSASKTASRVSKGAACVTVAGIVLDVYEIYGDVRKLTEGSEKAAACTTKIGQVEAVISELDQENKRLIEFNKLAEKYKDEIIASNDSASNE